MFCFVCFSMRYFSFNIIQWFHIFFYRRHYYFKIRFKSFFVCFMNPSLFVAAICDFATKKKVHVCRCFLKLNLDPVYKKLIEFSKCSFRLKYWNQSFYKISYSYLVLLVLFLLSIFCLVFLICSFVYLLFSGTVIVYCCFYIVIIIFFFAFWLLHYYFCTFALRYIYHLKYQM